MNAQTETELSISELRQKRRDAEKFAEPEEKEFSENGKENHFSETRRVLNQRKIARAPQLSFESAPREEDDEPRALPFDPARALDALVRRWYLWIGMGAMLGAAVFCWCYLRTHCIAQMQLIRRDVPMMFKASEAGEAFKPQQFTEATLGTLIRSPEIFRRVSEKTKPKIPAGKLAQQLFANAEQQSEIVNLIYMGPEKPAIASYLLNTFAGEIVRFTQDLQVREGTDAAKFLGDKLAAVEINLAALNAEMKEIPQDLKVLDTDKQAESYMVQLSELETKYELARIELEASNPVAEKLQLAKDELTTLLTKYTEAHPLVQDQQKKIQLLEKQTAGSTNPVPAGASAFSGADGLRIAANPQARALAKQVEGIKALKDRLQTKLAGLSEKNLGYATMKSRYQSLALIRSGLISRQREAELYAQNAVGFYQVLTPATPERASTKVNWKKSGMLIVGATFLGMLMMAGFIVVGEFLNDRIKTAADLKRVTGLPVLATLGELDSMSEEAKAAWAFRTWTILKGKITETQNGALVCGVISAEHGEGRSTWTNLLAKTAHQRGLRVLVAATRPSPETPLHPHEKLPAPEGLMSLANVENVVAFPFQATQQLNDPKSPSIVHIPLPGWVWNLERREQWQAALNEWSGIENLVFLVELPPACQPEAILLAENLPQLIWLSESGKISSRETQAHLETLRHAGCNLVGTVLNRVPFSFAGKYFSRLFGTTMMALAFLLSCLSVNGAETNLPASSVSTTVATNVISTGSKSGRAAWQQRLTLGPGDILTLGYYGETNWTKPDVSIGMDGRVSYLHAHDVVAAGLTVDELRDKLNAELSKYYRSPHVLVTPVAYRSKKYYVLGRVTAKGVYVLDRPLTVLEAVTRARGLETALVDRNTKDMADLQRSFLVRQGQRVPLDFEKLFHEGDFSQNVAIEPEDFLYFAPANLKEIYVVGQVRTPGVFPYTEHSSVVRAITESGGFTEQAYKRHVVVIRGSLSRPQTFVVNTWAILDAREVDFKLQPRDIVYISKRPFIKAEELLDVAATSFIQSAVTAWTGANIGPIFKTPFIPGL